MATSQKNFIPIYAISSSSEISSASQIVHKVRNVGFDLPFSIRLMFERSMSQRYASSWTVRPRSMRSFLIRWEMRSI